MQLIRLPETLAKTGLTRSVLYRMVDEGSFPKPAKLGARAIAWSSTEVEEWIAKRLASRETADA